VKFDPVTPELTELICERQYDAAKKLASNIFGYTGPIFTIFSPHESTLGTDDRAGPYFPICQGTLPWQPNNVAIMKAGKLMLRAFFARSPDVSLVLFCYYLIGVDTAAPSGLYARFCHAFLVISALINDYINLLW